MANGGGTVPSSSRSNKESPFVQPIAKGFGGPRRLNRIASAAFPTALRRSERGFTMLQRIRRKDDSALELARFKEVVRDQFFMLLLDEKGAVAAIPALLEGHEKEAPRWLEDVRKVATASGPLGTTGKNRITDAAINIYPTLADKASILQNAIDLAHALGIDTPKVAILSAVETVNPKIPSTLEAAALCKMVDRGQIRGAVVDGPLAFDNAISAEAARTKGIVSPVAGEADIFLVPDLTAGNMLAKQLTYLVKADSAGVVMGARVPIVLTSRADSAQARLASCAVAAAFAWSRRGGDAAREETRL